MTSSKKDHQAYDSINITDGLLRGTIHRFDALLDMTQDDLAIFKKTLLALTPRARLLVIKKNIDELTNSSPAIQIRIDEIRSIHAKLSKSDTNLSGEDLDSLQKADFLWYQILVMRDVHPLAIKGQKSGVAQSKRRTGHTKLTESQIFEVQRRYRDDYSTYGLAKELSNKYDVTRATIHSAKNKKIELN